MKTKLTLLVGLAIATVLGLSRPALGNVVGYVNVPLPAGYLFIENPLNTTNNSINRILAGNHVPDASRVYVWDVADQVFLTPSVYFAGPQVWSIDYDLPVGMGFVLFTPWSWTNTFVGEVMQGSLTNFVAGTNRWTFLGSMVPMSGRISTDLGFPGIDGANSYFFREQIQKFSEAYTYFDGHGWFDPIGVFGTGGPFCRVAESFFVFNPRPDTNWIRNFTVTPAAPKPNYSTISRSSSPISENPIPKIREIAVGAGKVTLVVERTPGQPYDVEFSTDCRSWSKAATNQTSGVWTGILPNKPRGYFQVANP